MSNAKRPPAYVYDFDLAAGLGKGAGEQMNFRVTPDGRLKKRDGMTLFCEFGAPLRGAAYVDAEVIRGLYACMGGALYRFANGVLTMVTTLTTSEGEIAMIPFGERLLVADGERLLAVGISGVYEVAGYVPLLAAEAEPSGEGIVCESRNLLTDRVRLRFAPNESAVYHLQGDVLSVQAVLVDGITMAPGFYTVGESASGKAVALSDICPRPVSYLEVQYTLKDSGWRAHLCRFTRGVVFHGGAGGSRLYLYGHRDNPACYCHTEPHGGSESELYFPIDGLTQMGMGEIAVTGLCPFMGKLMIFTEGKTRYTCPELDGIRGGVVCYRHPLTLLNDEVGHTALTAPVLAGNEVIGADASGVYGWHNALDPDVPNVSLLSEAVSDRLGRDFFPHARMAVDRRRCEILFFGREKTAVYQYQRKVWYLFDAFSVSRIIDRLPEGIAFANPNGAVFCFTEEADTDNGRTVTARFESEFSDLGHPIDFKDLHRIFLTLDPGEGKGLTVSLLSETGRSCTHTGESACQPSSVGAPTDCRLRTPMKRISRVKVTLTHDGAGEGCTVRRLSAVASRRGEGKTREHGQDA